MINRTAPALGLFGLAALLPGVALAQGTGAVAASGDTAWVLTATALVLFMTLPGLALFYGGLVRAKNVLSVMAQCVAIACLASMVWLFGGYSLAFSGHGPLIGDLGRFGLFLFLVLVLVVKRTTGLRIGDEAIDEGLDLASHGEKAYRSVS